METDKLATAKSYMRRNWDVAKLKAQSDALFGLATEEVTITSHGFEGGSASGQISFPKILLMQAIEELILEKDSTAPRPPSQTIHPSFSSREVQT